MIGAITAAQGIMSELASLAGVAAGAAAGGATTPTPPTGGASFSDLFDSAINRLDGDVSTAGAQATSFAAGNNEVPLSDVMVSLEQANLSLQLASGVRDKVTTAYSNVMNMPV